MTTLTTAIDSVLDARENRQDFDIPLKDFSLSLNVDGDKIVGCIDGRDYVPTNYCLRQMAKWHNLPLGILRNLTEPVYKQNGDVLFDRDSTDLGLLVSLFKNGIRDGRVNPDKVFKFRTYGDGTLRAMLSDMYAIIDNVWYLEHLQDVFSNYPDGEVKFNHWNTDGDTIYGNLKIPGIEANHEDGEHGGMLFIGNCEIGKQRISIAPAVWRQICTNGMMGWAKGQMWDKVHRGAVDLKGLASEITVKIADKIKLINDGITTLRSTQEHEFVKGVKPSQIIAQIADSYKLTPGQKGQAVATVGEYVNHESAYRNLYGIINSITRMAQTQEPAEQHRIEAVGGQLAGYSDKDWNRLNVLAGSMNEDKYNKILGRVAV